MPMRWDQDTILKPGFALFEKRLVAPVPLAPSPGRAADQAIFQGYFFFLMAMKTLSGVRGSSQMRVPMAS
jgi:hypothetical protein